MAAALRGSREIGFTVLSMSTSLVAVFIPILLMAGSVGRLFREFAVTLTVAIFVSLVVSLTTTPMLCARFLRSERERRHGLVYRVAEAGLDAVQSTYERALGATLGHQGAVLALTLATLGLSVYLFVIVPKGFFPQQDTGRLIGSLQAAQDVRSPRSRRSSRSTWRSSARTPRSTACSPSGAEARATPLACSSS